MSDAHTGGNAAEAGKATDMTQDVRFAVAMSGGVSLAVWMGGIAREINLLQQASNLRMNMKESLNSSGRGPSETTDGQAPTPATDGQAAAPATDGQASAPATDGQGRPPAAAGQAPSPARPSSA